MRFFSRERLRLWIGMGIVTALGCTGGFQCPTGAATLTSVTYLEPIVVTRGVATEFTGTAEIGTYNFIAQDPAVSNALGQRVLKIDGQKFTATIPTLVGGIIHDVSIRRLGSSNGPTTRIMLTSMTGGRGIEVASPLRTGQATTVYFGLTDKRSGASRVEVVNLPAGLTYSLPATLPRAMSGRMGPAFSSPYFPSVARRRRAPIRSRLSGRGGRARLPKGNSTCRFRSKPTG